LNQVSIDFAEGITLSDFISHIRQITRTAKYPEGIPIVIDSEYLEQNKELNKNKIYISLSDISLKSGFSLGLSQLSLTYEICDGILIVTGKKSLLDAIGKMAERGELSINQLEMLVEIHKAQAEVSQLLVEFDKISFPILFR
jgi:hypothetical protein